MHHLKVLSNMSSSIWQEPKTTLAVSTERIGYGKLLAKYKELLTRHRGAKGQGVKRKIKGILEVTPSGSSYQSWENKEESKKSLRRDMGLRPRGLSKGHFPAVAHVTDL